MILNMRTFGGRLAIYISAVVLSGLFLALKTDGGPAGAQAVNSLYVTPASGSYSVGASFTLSIRVNSGTEPVNTAQAVLTYPSGLLQYVSIDASGSAFGVDASSSGGGGTVNVARGTTSPVTGDQLVAKVTFKVLAAGSATIGMAPESVVYSANTYNDILTARNGGSYQLSAPSAPPPAPSPSPGSTAPPPSASKPKAVSSSGSPLTTVAPHGSQQATPLPGDSEVELQAPVILETKNGSGKEIAKVEYLLNNKVIATYSQAPFTHSVDTAKLRNASYTLTTKTYYKDGKVDTSSSTLMVRNAFSLQQAYLQLKHYAWLAVILLIIAGELVYLKFFRKRLIRSQGLDGSAGDGKPQAVVGDATSSQPAAGQVEPDGQLGSQVVTPQAEPKLPTDEQQK